MDEKNGVEQTLEDLKNGISKNVFAYVRVSTKLQLAKNTHLSQRASIYDYAKKHNLIVNEIFEDLAISGTVSDRKQYLNLLSRLKTDHSIKIVLVAHVDRFSRTKIDGMDFIVQIARLNCIIIEVADETIINPNDDMGLLSMTFKMISSDQERKKINDNQKKGIKRVRTRPDGTLKPWGRPLLVLNKTQIKDIEKYLEAKLKVAQIARLLKLDYRSLKREMISNDLLKERKLNKAEFQMITDQFIPGGIDLFKMAENLHMDLVILTQALIDKKLIDQITCELRI